MVKVVPTAPSHQSPPGPHVSGQRGCSSRHDFYLDFKQFESPFKAIVLRALWVPRNGGGGCGARWEFTLRTGNPCVIFKAAGMGGMARGDSRSTYPLLSGLGNSLRSWGCGWDSDNRGAAGKSSPQLTPGLENWRGAGAELCRSIV